MALEATDGNFDELVLNSDKPVIVDFWAEWCGPCRMVGPIVEEVGVDYDLSPKECRRILEADEGSEKVTGTDRRIEATESTEDTAPNAPEPGIRSKVLFRPRG